MVDIKQLKKYDIEYSTVIGEDEQKRLNIKPLGTGKLKGLFFPSINYGREIIELAQRLDIDFDTVTVDRYWDMNKWGLGDHYDIRGSQYDFSVMYNNMENVLTSEQHYDVLVIPGLNGWSYFTEKARQAILRRVKEGAGLVLIKPFDGKDQPRTPELEELSPIVPLMEEGFNPKNYPKLEKDAFIKGKWLATDHFITQGVPFELFPFDELAIYPYKATGDVILRTESGEPVGAVHAVGKGRVVAYSYYPRDILPQHADYMISGCFDSSLGNWKGGKDETIPYSFLDYGYSLIAKSMVWAAGRESNCTISQTTWSGEQLNVSLSATTDDVKLDNASEDRTLQYEVLNDWDQVIMSGETTTLSIVVPVELRCGRLRFGMTLRQAGKVLDWHACSVELPVRDAILRAEPSVEAVAAGNPFSVMVDVVTESNGTQSADSPSRAVVKEIALQVSDFYGNVYFEEKRTIGTAKSFEFTYTPNEISSLYLIVTVDLIVQGSLADRQVREVILTPKVRTFTDFEVFMVPQNRGHGDWINKLGELSREIGVTGLFPGSHKLSTESGASGMGTYWYNRMQYTERKEAYLRTMDKKHLYRVPCFNDDQFWEEIGGKIRETVKENSKFGPLSYFANDEGSITCYVDEQDLCFCPNCMSKMQTWLKQEYADLNELNQVWGTTFETWEQVEPYTAVEARRTHRYSSWGDHRRFMELSFANAYKMIGDIIRQSDPIGETRISGCQASTAYSGYDYYELHKHVGYVEAYTVGHQYEIHRSFANPSTILGCWYGYGNRGAHADHYVWNIVFHGIKLISLFYEHALLNPDFTPNTSSMDISRQTIEMRREGIGKLLLYGSKRDDLGVVIHYSMPSVHGSYIINDFKRYSDNRAGWYQLLEDLGYQYTLMSSQQIEQGLLIDRNCKLLILPYSIALSEKETQEIRAFVAGGGTIIGDFQTGLMDQHNQQFEKGQLDDLFGIQRLTSEAIPYFTNNSCVANAEFSHFSIEPGFKTKGEIANGIGLTTMESGIRAAEGTPAYFDDFMKQIAIITVAEQGKGHAIYLNASMIDYVDVRKDEVGAHIRRLLGAVIDISEVRKFATLKDAQGQPIYVGYESFYYSGANDAQYIGVLRNLNTEVKAGSDGVTVGTEMKEQTDREHVVLELSTAGHVYNVRSKQYLGYTDRVEADLNQGETLLITVLQQVVQSVNLEMKPRFERGGQLDLSAQAILEGGVAGVAEVLNVNFYDPTGAYEWRYSSNDVAEDGTVRLEHIIPLNEKTGEWRVVVKHVATGISTEHSFIIE